MPLIAMAHRIPYVATASVANLHDLEYKVEKAIAHPRRSLHPHPCALPARLGIGTARHHQGGADGGRERAVSAI